MTVIATDNFNRANGSVGANWTVHGPYNIPTIVSNVVSGAAATDYAATYNAANAGQDDMYTKADGTYVGGGFTATDVIVWCRMPNDGTETGYMGDDPTYGASGVLWTMQKATNGSFTSLAAGPGTPGGTHSIQIQAVGTTVSFLIDGVQVASVSDSTHSGATKRYGGIHIYSDLVGGCTLDNFEMGTIGAAPAAATPQPIVPRAAVGRASSW